MDLIPPFIRQEFREFCVGLSLRQIADIFSASDIERGTIKDSSFISGQRRTLVEEYYASLDWTKPQDAQKFLHAITMVLAQSYISEESKDFLRDLCRKEGFFVEDYRIYLSGKRVKGKFKNLIFAADGPKPEIVLTDSVNNDVQIVKNAEYCLVYDRPILPYGLLWNDLVDWYWDLKGKPDVDKHEKERALYWRLAKSLGSEPEKLLFRTYFGRFRDLLGEKLPALAPQVYLHYDPYTVRQLAFEKRLFRQRIDFLLLFSDQDRIVIEVDGKQHYSENEQASPKLYAEMVAEDRRLRIAGYEVYRFGVYELNGDRGTKVIETFFQQLFRKHDLLNR